MLSEVYQYLSFSSITVSFLYAAVIYSRLHTNADKSLAWYVFFRFLFEGLATWTAIYNVNNIPLFYAYGIIELLFLAHILTGYYYMKSIRKRIALLAGLLAILSLTEAIFSWPDRMNSVSRILSCIFLIWLCYEVVKRLISISSHWKNSFKLPELWLSLGTSTYLFFHMVIVAVNNFSIERFGVTFTRELWSYNSLANTICNLFYLFGLWITYHRINLKTQ